MKRLFLALGAALLANAALAAPRLDPDPAPGTGSIGQGDVARHLDSGASA
jgi:hypothetical protein